MIEAIPDASIAEIVDTTLEKAPPPPVRRGGLPFIKDSIGKHPEWMYIPGGLLVCGIAFANRKKLFKTGMAAQSGEAVENSTASSEESTTVDSLSPSARNNSKPSPNSLSSKQSPPIPVLPLVRTPPSQSPQISAAPARSESSIEKDRVAPGQKQTRRHSLPLNSLKGSKAAEKGKHPANGSIRTRSPTHQLNLPAIPFQTGAASQPNGPTQVTHFRIPLPFSGSVNQTDNSGSSPSSVHSNSNSRGLQTSPTRQKPLSTTSVACSPSPTFVPISTHPTQRPIPTANGTGSAPISGHANGHAIKGPTPTTNGSRTSSPTFAPISSHANGHAKMGPIPTTNGSRSSSPAFASISSHANGHAIKRPIPTTNGSRTSTPVPVSSHTNGHNNHRPTLTSHGSGVATPSFVPLSTQTNGHAERHLTSSTNSSKHPTASLVSVSAHSNDYDRKEPTGLSPNVHAAPSGSKNVHPTHSTAIHIHPAPSSTSSAAANGSYAPQPSELRSRAKPKPPSFQDLICSKTNQDKIQTIVETLYSCNAIALAAEKKNLETIGEEIKDVHTLCFLWTIFKSPDLKEKMKYIFSKWLWKPQKMGFMLGVNGVGGMQRYTVKTLEPYLDEWARQLGTSKEAVIPLIQEGFKKKDWDSLVSHLIEARLPRR